MTAQCAGCALRAIYHHTITAEDDVGMDAMDVGGPPRPTASTPRELKLLGSLFPMLRVPVNCGMKLKLLPDVARCHALCFKAIMQTVNDNRRSEITRALIKTRLGVRISWINAAIYQVGEIQPAAVLSTQS